MYLNNITFMTTVLFTVLILPNRTCDGACPTNALWRLPYVLEHAIWRGWHQAAIYTTDNESDCKWSILRLVKCLGVNGVGSVLNAPGDVRVETRLGVVFLTPSPSTNYTEKITKQIQKLTDKEMNTASQDWLIVTRSVDDFKFVKKILNSTALRFDQTILVAYPDLRHRYSITTLGLCDRNFVYESNTNKNFGNNLYSHRNTNDRRYYNNNCSYESRDGRNCVKNEFVNSYYRTTERFRNLKRNQSLKSSGFTYSLLGASLNHNFSREFEMFNVSKFSLRLQLNEWRRDHYIQNFTGGIHVVQYFKVRVNSTLYVTFLGSWTVPLSMAKMQTPYPVEARTFLGEDIVVGRCNATEEGVSIGDEEGPSAPVLLDDVLHFLTVRLNTTTSTKFYTKLGFRTYEGTWTGLLGALMGEYVDVALEPVMEHPPRHQDMDFIFPIADTMCNIYIRHQETSTVRDIFLAPFSAGLVGCVVAVAVVAALAVVLISRLTNTCHPFGYIEALIWSTGILCQQGATWTPKNPAASVLLIVCLFFAVVTYNAYAAFITSVLSVRVASVDTVAAVLQSPHLKIGYIRNGADQMYLMSTKDVQLNEFYIRGYSDAQNLVSSAEEGLERAAKQDYAFFAGQRAARSTIRSLSQARGRCSLRELPVPSTRAQLSFPLPRRSPYARPLLVSLLMLRSSGALARLEAALVPGMPQCAPPPAFASARAADVTSALILLVTGFIAALVIGFGEYIWKNRLNLNEYISLRYNNFIDFVKSMYY